MHPRDRWTAGELPPHLPVRQYGDPVLRTPADPVREFDEDLARLVDVMWASMYAVNGVGLAANQIGVGRSVFVMDCQGVVAVVANPQLVEVSDDEEEDLEGCLSVAGRHYPTPRARTATVEGFDATGRPVRLSGTGEVARCLQHETDHLVGRLYIDRLRGAHRRQARRDLEVAAPSRTATRPAGLPGALGSVFRRPRG